MFVRGKRLKNKRVCKGKFKVSKEKAKRYSRLLNKLKIEVLAGEVPDKNVFEELGYCQTPTLLVWREVLGKLVVSRLLGPTLVQQLQDNEQD
jgi:hypothetical protein